jgi:hypothetical protein
MTSWTAFGRNMVAGANSSRHQPSSNDGLLQSVATRQIAHTGPLSLADQLQHPLLTKLLVDHCPVHGLAAQPGAAEVPDAVWGAIERYCLCFGNNRSVEFSILIMYLDDFERNRALG